MIRSTLILFTLFISLQVRALDLDYLRSNYTKAVTDESLCKSIIDKLGKDLDSDIHKAYYGAYCTIWANHCFNPMSKLKTFNIGKAILEKAVSLSPNDVEIRFLRYSIQKKCPSFLGYDKNLSADKKFLQAHVDEVSSAQLKKMIKAILNEK